MMKKSREFDNILDECLERVLVKGETIEQCLAQHPEYASELEPLLRTALDTKGAVDIKPRPEFRERARHQFQAALRDMQPKGRPDFFYILKPSLATIITVVVVLLAGGGTVAAASNSLPDSPLYQVKLATEAVQLALAQSPLGKAELYVKLADKRVAEIIKMVDKGKTAQVEETVQRLNAELIAMASLAVPGRGERAESQMASFKAEPSPVLEEAPRAQITVPAPTPAPVPAPTLAPPPASVPAPALVPPVEEAPSKAALKAPGTSENIGSGKGGKQDVGDIKSDKQSKLKEILSHRAIENREALREVLERVPESVKPALRRAIEEAGAGYERALRHLD